MLLFYQLLSKISHISPQYYLRFFSQISSQNSKIISRDPWETLFQTSPFFIFTKLCFLKISRQVQTRFFTSIHLILSKCKNHFQRSPQNAFPDISPFRNFIFNNFVSTKNCTVFILQKYLLKSSQY
jgi:hypothetical protein